MPLCVVRKTCELERHVLVVRLELLALGEDDLHAAGGHFELPLRAVVLRSPDGHLEALAVHADQVASTQVLRGSVYRQRESSALDR